MFNLDVPEKVIADKSGHHSIEVLRSYMYMYMYMYMYEHTSVEVKYAAGDAIANKTRQSCGDVKHSSKARFLRHTSPAFLAACTINFNINYMYIHVKRSEGTATDCSLWPFSCI